MSVLRDAPIYEEGLGVPRTTLMEVLATYFWQWFRAHAEDKIASRKILFISLSVRVRDLRGLFLSLFGPEVQ